MKEARGKGNISAKTMDITDTKECWKQLTQNFAYALAGFT